MKFPTLFKDPLDSNTTQKYELIAAPGEKCSLFYEWNQSSPIEVLFHAKQDAELECVFVQSLPESAECMAKVKIIADRNAQIRCTLVHQGGAKTQIELETICSEEGSNIQTQAISHAKRNQKQSILSKAVHPVPHTQSDLKVWSVANDHAHTLFSGIITIEKGAHHTEALQKNKNLILSEKATVDSIPQLFIFNDEVKCAHGSSTSTLDPEQFLYLQSRGITQAEAERMITQGFIEHAVHWIKNDQSLKRVKQVLNLVEEEP